MSAAEQNKGELPLVTVATVVSSDLTTTIHISGTLIAREEVLVSPQINGYEIKQINVDIGDNISAGDTLIVLDKDTLEAQLAQADADVAKAKASIRQTQAQTDSQRQI